MDRQDIALLSQETIDKISAGEVIERPASVVKELTENAIDAGATAISVEIKEGGIDYIRVTDNGCGIPREQISLAFLPHSTSKIRSSEDLLAIHSLGFRGEALSSIAAVSRVELISKTSESLTGSRYVIEGAKEISLTEIGAPDGTTFIVRQLFFNTPARRKFLRTAATEGNYISDIMERLALSHPGISFRFISNGKQKMATAGKGSLKDAIYQIYGRSVAMDLLPVRCERETYTLEGFIGKPSLTRGNRSFENFFINGRYVRSQLLSKALEEGYKGYMMQHQYPFCVLELTFPDGSVDVNVHPTKMEVRFDDADEVYAGLASAVSQRLLMREDISNIPIQSQKPVRTPAPSAKAAGAEPFERSRLEEIRRQIMDDIKNDSPYEKQYDRPNSASHTDDARCKDKGIHEDDASCKDDGTSTGLSDQKRRKLREEPSGREMNLSERAKKGFGDYTQPKFFSQEARESFTIVGQVFGTYWIIQYADKMYIIDQHAAHEKVLYERTMAQLKDKEMTSQLLSPPIIVSLSPLEQEAYDRCSDAFYRIGFRLEPFGGKEYAIKGVPGNLFQIDARTLFLDMIAQACDFKANASSELVMEKVASMSCKAAVKGNNKLSLAEIKELIAELLTLENPYHCPHGRPTIISFSHYDLDRKFKRIVT